MAALFEEDQPGSGDGVGEAPGGEWRYVHVVAAVEHEGGRMDAGEGGGEIEIVDGLRDGVADGGLIAEVAHVFHVCVAFCGGVEDHFEVVAEAGPGGVVGVGGERLCFVFVLLFDVGEGLRQEMNDAFERGRGGV